VGDAARAVSAIVDGKTSGVFNLGAGCSRPMKDYVEAIRSELRTSLEPVYGAVQYRPDQVMLLEADISRLTMLTGWRPKISIVEGIRETVEFERSRFSIICQGIS